MTFETELLLVEAREVRPFVRARARACGCTMLCVCVCLRVLAFVCGWVGGWVGLWTCCSWSLRREIGLSVCSSLELLSRW